MRRTVVCLVVVALLTVSVPAAAAGSSPATVEVKSGPLVARVTQDPFGISFTENGREFLTTFPPGLDLTDPTGRHGPLGFAVGPAAEAHELGYHLQAQVPLRWFHAKKVTAVEEASIEASAARTGKETVKPKNSGGLSLRVQTDDPLGREFTVRIAPRGSGVIEVNATLNDTTAVVLTGAAFRRSADEHFLGFGERSDGVDQTGRVVTAWNEEGPFSGGAAIPVTDVVLGSRWQGPEPLPGTNFSMPSFVSSRGYGFLLDSTWLNEFRLAVDSDQAWSVNTREPSLGYRVYAGGTPAKALERFTSDVGRQPDPAEWFFGPWYQPRGSIKPQDWRDQDVPVTVAQTYTHYLPCGGHVGTAPAARKASTDAYHAAGYKVTTYVSSWVCPEHPEGAYDEGDAKGYFIKLLTGQSYPIYNVGDDVPYYGVIDFTNPEAAKWWQGLITPALEDGYDGWMEDYGEYVPADSVASDGRMGLAYHNDYCTTYHATSHALTWPKRGKDFAQFVRCGYTGTPRVAHIVWSGDPSEDWSAADGLAAMVSQGQSMGLSGVAYWGSDIGGFHPLLHAERTTPELLTRWLEFGAFSGIMRTEADGDARPDVEGITTYPNERAQVWDPEVQPVWRKFSKLRTQLFPYIWQAAQEYQSTGMPIMRHLALAYPNDPKVYTSESEYEFLFGPDLLVAPVVEDGARERTLYLPQGKWINFWEAVTFDGATGSFDVKPGAVDANSARAGSTQTAKVYEGGRLITVAAPLDEIPLFVRQDACLTLLPADTDTLAEVGNQPGLVHLSNTIGHWRSLAFGSRCGGTKVGAHSVGRAGMLASRLPATGGTTAGFAIFLSGAAVLAAGYRRRRPLAGR
ncbi:MAG: TIM-barrel domain-containing protein [Actinomycetota bacterium]